MSDRFKDHFSKDSERYAAVRPTYPDELFHRLGALVPSKSCAWDCGTGNGQAAVALASLFTRIVGSDPSRAQIRQAIPNPGVSYVAALAEQSCLADRSVDLTVVAQALHWFDTDRFYAEVRRVTKPQGIIAAWCYRLFRISPVIDEYIDEYYAGTVGRFWPVERRHVDAGYQSLPFPFEKVVVPTPVMRHEWDLGQLVEYVRTWSATRSFVESLGTDPVPALEDKLARFWGDADRRWVVWPLTLLVGRVG